LIYISHDESNMAMKEKLSTANYLIIFFTLIKKTLNNESIRFFL